MPASSPLLLTRPGDAKDERRAERRGERCTARRIKVALPPAADDAESARSDAGGEMVDVSYCMALFGNDVAS